MRNRNIFIACLVALAVSIGGSVGCSSAPGEDEATTSEAVTTQDILARAQEWVNDRVPYCGGVRGGTDFICGGTCSRPSAPWNDFRTDCSGFVSWCWQIPDDPTTSSYVHDRGGSNGWTTIPIDALQAGDAIVCDGHIKLFSRFASATSAEIYEEFDCGEVARKTVQSFSRSGDSIFFHGDGRVYHPIRRNGGASSPPPPPPSSGCSVHGDGKLYCTNKGGSAMYASTNTSSAVVNHLRTTTSWFDCWGTGQLHAGGNTTWYHTLGDDNGNFGWVPAVDLSTTSAFDANPTAHGLSTCGGAPPPPNSACSVHADGKLYCNNVGGSAMYASTNTSSGVVNHLRTTTSWFDCWGTGQLHSGGNTTWYHTLGDDNGNFGWVPAVDLSTSSSFDANPANAGLARCR